jgi:hypothetical protein
MSPVALSFISLAILCATNAVNAQDAPNPAVSTFPATPLIDKHWASPTDLPYKVDTDTNLLRGPQTGYNICNSTTEGPNSQCQTSYLNTVDDWCLWAPPVPNSEVFNLEGEMVAWCTKPGHGTRLIPAGAITGLQYMKTADYVQVTGFLNQEMMNMIAGHPGGEMDGGGADLRGNPLGAAIFSSGFATGDGKKFAHTPYWHNFMGNDQFCFKACDASKPDAPHYCEHIYDRVGCEFNAPSQAQKGVFEACEGESQDFPGIYTDAAGARQTYTQPAESLGAIQSVPTVRMPKSSNCQQFESTKLFSAIATVTASVSAPASSGSVAPTSGASTSPRTTGGSSPTSSGAAPTGSGNSAETLAISGVASFLGVVFAALFLS